MTYEEIQALLSAAAQAENLGSYDEVEQLCNKVLEESDRIEAGAASTATGIFRSKALRLLGATARYRGNYSLSLERFGAALDISESLGATAEISKAVGNIGNVHEALSEYDKALEHYHRALAIAEELDDKAGMALWLGNIGLVHSNRSEYSQALEYLGKALKLDEALGVESGIARHLGNIGVVHYSLSEYSQALEYFRRALALDEKRSNKAGTAVWLGNIGLVYSDVSDYSRALEYYGKALALDEELGNKAGVARHFGNIGNVYIHLSDNPHALQYYNKALLLAEELGDKAGVALCLGNIGIVHLDASDYGRALESSAKSLALDEELGNKAGVARHLGNIGLIHYSLLDYPLALEYIEKSLVLSKELGNKSGMSINIANIGRIYAARDFDCRHLGKAEECFFEAMAINEEIGDRYQNAQIFKLLSELCSETERWKEAKEYFEKFYETEKEIQSDEARKRSLQIEHQKQMAAREQQLEAERQRARATEELLHNTLPPEIANRLLSGEGMIADFYEGVSVLFMDLVNFTVLSQQIPPKHLVHLLNKIFSSVDAIMERNGLEKIKTIGDAYMAAAGAPVAQPDHAVRTAKAALELRETMDMLQIEPPEEYGDRAWTAEFSRIGIRIGVHSGQAVGGVIGDKKFVFDLWGDAVNTASRMESHGKPGKIHASEDFRREILKTSPDHTFVFVSRGEMEIKGKGKMQTYFLEK